MLINIDPILSPQILHTLRSMGHGDQIVLCDINFPAHSIHSNVIRLDGVDMARAMKAILSVFPLDSFVPAAVHRMEVDGKPDDTEDSLSSRILVQEHIAFPEALHLFSSNRLKVTDNTVEILAP